MKARSGGSAASSASTAASRRVTATDPKRVRCSFAALALPGGVATALPTSSSRDCTSASCVRGASARAARGRRLRGGAARRLGARRERHCGGALALLLAKLSRQPHLRWARQNGQAATRQVHKLLGACRSEAGGRRDARHAVQLIHVAQRRKHGVVFVAPLARVEARGAGVACARI
jgi:hypothetical protein